MLTAVLALCPAAFVVGAEPTPLSQAHAHNDYAHQRPLFDALAQGFCSVEADIFLVDDKLLVGHTPFDLTASRTLQRLYLDPLRERVRKNKGRVFAAGPQFTLLIDIKSEAATTYRALAAVLAAYRDILTEVRDGKLIPRAVTVVISGNRSQELIAADSPRFAGIDGRLSDLDSNLPGHLLPLISDRWTSHFRWRGEGPMPASEKQKLHDIVRKAHQAGRRIRFWATPEKATVWSELREAQVDHINTDNLKGLRTFLLQ